MKRFRLTTLMLLVVIAGLGFALLAQQRQADRREAVLRAKIKEWEQTDTEIRWSEMNERRLRRMGWTLQPPAGDQVVRKSSGR
jgi:hypothetical protein